MTTSSIQSRYSSTQESLELLYHISREIASTLDLTVVLQRVLSLSLRTIGAVSGSLIVIGEDGTPLEAAIIYEDTVLEPNTERIQNLVSDGLAGWVIEHAEPALIFNTQRDERWVAQSSSQTTEKAKSALSVPLIARDTLVGVITLSHPVPLFFSEEHLELIQAIADQAAIAVLNARLYETSKHQARIMGALAESAAAITASLNLDEVLQRILEKINQALQVEVVSLALLDENKDTLVFRASTAPQVMGKVVPANQGIIGQVLSTEEGLIVAHASQDAHFIPHVDGITSPAPRAIACAPIRSSDEVIGVIQAVNPLDGMFKQDALIVLNGIGNLAGTAIQHAQLFEELQAAHHRYRDLYNSSADAILITDRNGRIIEANYQTFAYTGLSLNELRSRHIGEIHNLDTKTVGESLEYIAPGETLTYESELYTQSERIIPVEVNVHTISIEGKDALQWTFRDITARKELDQLRDDLISMVYHDLRSPLSNVLSSLDVLESIQSFDDDPTIKALFEIAVRSTKRIERLTNSLLDFNRLEAGQPVTNTSPTDARELIESAVVEVLPIANNKNQEIIIRVQEGLPPAEIDDGMIQRVLINLMENAVKYTPPGSHITVGAAQAGDHIAFWVEDTGPGIPPEKRATIFDKYTRLHGKGGPKGIGLGLAYCRLAVEGHGGRIWVDEATSGGARFAFTLPIASPEPQEETPTSEAPAEPAEPSS